MLSRLSPLLKGVTRALGVDLKRHRPEFPSGCVSLRPDDISKCSVLLAYILEPFQRQRDKAVSTSHIHHWESVLIAETWREFGYWVNVIDYHNHEFIPRKRYDYFVSARTHFRNHVEQLHAKQYSYVLRYASTQVALGKRFFCHCLQYWYIRRRRKYFSWFRVDLRRYSSLYVENLQCRNHTATQRFDARRTQRKKEYKIAP